MSIIIRRFHNSGRRVTDSPDLAKENPTVSRQFLFIFSGLTMQRLFCLILMASAILDLVQENSIILNLHYNQLAANPGLFPPDTLELSGMSTPPSPTPPSLSERTPRRPRTPTPPPLTPEDRVVIGGHGLRKTPSRTKAVLTPAVVPPSRKKRTLFRSSPGEAGGSRGEVDRAGRSMTQDDPFQDPSDQPPLPLSVPNVMSVPSTPLPERNGHCDEVTRRMIDLEKDQAEEAHRIVGLETENAEYGRRIIELEKRVAVNEAGNRVRDEVQVELERQVALLMAKSQSLEVPVRGLGSAAEVKVDIEPREIVVASEENDTEARLSKVKEQCRIALHAQEARTLKRLREALVDMQDF